ncbi:MAG: alcohol dehydrogenase catalytic domain-containing protein [Acidimicrobiales bacterium]
MRALVVRAPHDVELTTVDEPVVADDEVLVAPLLNGMCGTDLELIDGTIDPAYVRYPLILGHEWVGELLDDVPGVATRKDRVVVEGVVPCGICAECLIGATNRCMTYDEIGFTRPGAIAERIAVPTRLVHRIDESVNLDDAVLIEPMAVVWRALTRFALRDDLNVVVVGDGAIALLVTHLVRRFHPARVVVVGRRIAQASLARAAGADEFVTDVPVERFDLVVEAAGTAASASTAIALAERGAMVILLGLPAHGTRIDLAPDDIVNDDIVIQGSFSYTSQAFGEVVGQVNAGHLQPSFLITHRYALSQCQEAIGALRGDVADDEPRGKVVISLP